MKRNYWSIWFLLPIAIIVASAGLVYYIITTPWSDDNPPSLNEIQIVSGHVELITWNEGDEGEHSSINIKLQEQPGEFFYLRPYLDEVSTELRKASSKGSLVKFWVATRKYNYSPPMTVNEIWQAEIEGKVVSSYVDRVESGKSHVRLRKSLIVIFIILLDLIPGIYLYKMIKKKRLLIAG